MHQRQLLTRVQHHLQSLDLYVSHSDQSSVCAVMHVACRLPISSHLSNCMLCSAGFRSLDLQATHFHYPCGTGTLKTVEHPCDSGRLGFLQCSTMSYGTVVCFSHAGCTAGCLRKDVLVDGGEGEQRLRIDRRQERLRRIAHLVLLRVPVEEDVRRYRRCLVRVARAEWRFRPRSRTR